MIRRIHKLTDNFLTAILENNKSTKISVHSFFKSNFTNIFSNQNFKIRTEKVFPKKTIKKPSNFLLELIFERKPSIKNKKELAALFPSIFNKKYINLFNFECIKRDNKEIMIDALKFLLSVDEIEMEAESEISSEIKEHKLIL